MTRRSYDLLLTAMLCFAFTSGSAEAVTLSITLTPLALGLSGDDGALGTKLNHASEILADQGGLRTLGSGIGGSVLEINGLGLADDASNGDHLVTITTRTHTDTLTGLPVGHDYSFGAITLTPATAGSKRGAAGKLGGLGLRAFTVDTTSGLRQNGPGGRARLEGSKEVSGGTGDPSFLAGNGAPHVDELALFEFDGDYEVEGKSIEVLLTNVKFGNADSLQQGLRVALSISVLGGGTIDKILASKIDTSTLLTDADGNVRILFSAIPELMSSDLVASFSVSALDDDLETANLKGTAEHFLISGMSGIFQEVPEPSAGVLLLLGFASVASITATRGAKQSGPPFSWRCPLVFRLHQSFYDGIR